jgi:hypothetical protein
VLAWTLLASPFHPHNAHKSWKRVLGDKTFYFLTKELSVPQLQWLLGDTQDVYMDWTKRNGLPALIDELGENARLLWIERRRTDRVILYLHGAYDHLLVSSLTHKFIKAELICFQWLSLVQASGNAP